MVRRSLELVRRSPDLATTMPLACLGALVALWAPPGVLRAFVAVPFVLVLPGYSLMAALFGERPFALAERVLLSIGLSLAVAILGGLLLNLTPWGLQTGSWVLLLAIVTLGASGVALKRRARRARETPIEMPTGRRLGSGWWPGPPVGPRWWDGVLVGWRHGVVFAVAAAVLCGAVMMAQVSARPAPAPAATELCLMPDQQTSQARVSHARVSQARTVRLCVQNTSTRTQRYILRLIDGGQVLASWPLVSVAPGDTWTTEVALPGSLKAGTTLDALLYRQGAPHTLYRHVSLLIGQ